VRNTNKHLPPASVVRHEARLRAKQAEVQAELARRGGEAYAGSGGGAPLRTCADCGAEFRSHLLDRCRHCRGYAHTRTGGRR